MTGRLATLALAALMTAAASLAWGDPEQDRLAFREHFQKRFPDVPIEEYANGIHAIVMREYGDLGSVSRFSRDRLNLYDTFMNFRHLDTKQ